MLGEGEGRDITLGIHRRWSHVLQEKNKDILAFQEIRTYVKSFRDMNAWFISNKVSSVPCLVHKTHAGRKGG